MTQSGIWAFAAATHCEPTHLNTGVGVGENTVTARPQPTAPSTRSWVSFTVVPLIGVALVPVFGIVLGGTMTAAALAVRRALDALSQRSGEVEAALSLGLSERDSRMEVIERPLSDALLPNLDQARTAGLVTLPGAFVGVLLATGSAAQAGRSPSDGLRLASARASVRCRGHR
ncbi:hypothetical protein JCM12141A_63400 [Mycolicibacterium hodleri]